MNIPTMDKIFKFLNGNTDLSNFEKPEKEEHHQGESSHQGQEHGGIGPDLEQRREHEEAGPHGRQEHGEREGRRSQGLLRRFN
uniref:YqzL family protein n=1 Tax=Meloidogyne hapla TaxID=6305 RepID=A0A1I8BQ97_MELHA